MESKLRSRKQTLADAIPTETQTKELCRLLHHALVQIRFYGYSQKTQQMTDLADALHDLPVAMIGDQEFNWECIKASLEGYEERYKGHLSGLNLSEEIERIRNLSQEMPPTPLFGAAERGGSDKI